MTPTQRMAAILRRLARAEGQLVSTVQLRRLCPDDYEIHDGLTAEETAARARKFRHDIEHLRRRGFVDTGLTAAQADMDNRQGVRLVGYMDKDPDLHLTPAEHAALNRARALLQRGPGAVEIQRGRGNRLDVALAVVRHLEEQDHREATGQGLAEALKVPVARLLDGLDALEEDVARSQDRGQPIVHGLRVERQYDEVNGELVGFHVYLADDRSSRDAARSKSPTFGQGMHHLGRFAYTPAETDERLSLVTEAMQHPDTPASDVERLHTAAGKLHDWHLLLTGEEWTPGNCCRPGQRRKERTAVS